MRIEKWSSDLHFDHINMIKWRGLDCTVEEMNDLLVEVWNQHIEPDEPVGLVGDAAMGRRELSVDHLGRLNGDIYMWPGNHDYCWLHSNRLNHYWLNRYGHYVTLMDDGLYDIEGLDQTVAISHFPYDGDHISDSRYDEFRMQDNGHWILCGHVHHMWRTHGSQINVGIDAWGRPITTAEIQMIIDAGPSFQPTPEVNPLL